MLGRGTRRSRADLAVITPMRALALAAFAVAILAATFSVDVSGASPAPISLGGELELDPGECWSLSYVCAFRGLPSVCGSITSAVIVAWKG
jgi:hypothetical protein